MKFSLRRMRSRFPPLYFSHFSFFLLIFFCCLFLSFCLSCSGRGAFGRAASARSAGVKGESPAQVSDALKAERDDKIKAVFDRVIGSLSREEKLCQLFIVSVDGTLSSASAVSYDIPPGGYILFTRNFTGKPEQIIALTDSTQSFYASKRAEKSECLPPFFAIDHEGGEVNRLRDIASPLPSAQSVARFLSPEKAEELYLYAAYQLAALGIQVNFAPVAETAGGHNTNFLGRRSFGSAEQVETYASAFVRAFNKGGIFCVLKHFPGNSNEDPHRTLPVLEGSEADIRELYVSPFIALTASLAEARNLKDAAVDPFPFAGVLMSHAVVPAFDAENPACFSHAAVTGLLKNELHFDGLIFSDDLYMLDGENFSLSDCVIKALRSGVHMCMLSRPVYKDIVSELAEKIGNDSELQKITDEALRRILKAKLRMGLLKLEVIDDGAYTLLPAQVEEDASLRLQNSLEKFRDAKQKGDALYYEDWSK